MPPLTIASVIHKDTALLELNWQLARKLNPTSEFQWLVADNRLENPGTPLTFGGDQVKLVPGAPLDTAIAQQVRASYHHALGLNQTIQHLNTRYALFLDPDYFIVQPDWIKLVLKHMEQSGLAFFGAPYHPKFYDKYRYFPCGICLFVDLERVPKETIDYLPEYDLANMPAGWEIRVENEFHARLRRKMSELPRPVAAALAIAARASGVSKLFQDRHRVQAARDTGYKIFSRYAGNPETPSECLVPVYRLPEDFSGPRHIFSGIPALLERKLPDNLSFIPKRPGYFTGRSFKDFGAPDAAGMGWEETLWNDRPFGFHMHGTLRKKLGEWSADDQMRFLQSLLEHFCDSLDFPASSPAVAQGKGR